MGAGLDGTGQAGPTRLLWQAHRIRQGAAQGGGWCRVGTCFSRQANLIWLLQPEQPGLHAKWPEAAAGLRTALGAGTRPECTQENPEASPDLDEEPHWAVAAAGGGGGERSEGDSASCAVRGSSLGRTCLEMVAPGSSSFSILSSPHPALLLWDPGGLVEIGECGPPGRRWLERELVQPAQEL